MTDQGGAIHGCIAADFQDYREHCDVQLILTMDGSSKNCEKGREREREREKIHDLKEVLRHHYRNAGLAFEVHHLALYIADLKEEISKKPSEESAVEVAYQKFLATGIREGLHCMPVPGPST